MSVSAFELFGREKSPSYRPIPTFIEPLDALLGGGIKPGLVTEIVGDSGLGKTTFCIQLCIDVQIPRLLEGLESHALFIDTENSFVVQRVRDMAKAFSLHCKTLIPKGYGSKAKVSENKIMSGIHVVKCHNFSQFEKIILSLNDFISRNRKIRLLIIDSIAFPFFNQGESFLSRTKSLYSIGQVLHYLAERYGLAVVVTNKITTRFDNSGEEYYVPFLGESWYHVPNQRIHLCWGKDGRTRIAEMNKGFAKPGKVEYIVNAYGVRY